MKTPFDILLAKDMDKARGPVAAIVRDVPGAWPEGTRVRKIVEQKDDAHEIGAEAVVLGCIGQTEHEGKKVYGYFVFWDDMPDVPVFVSSHKIAVVDQRTGIGKGRTER